MSKPVLSGPVDLVTGVDLIEGVDGRPESEPIGSRFSLVQSSTLWGSLIPRLQLWSQ